MKLIELIIQFFDTNIEYFKNHYHEIGIIYQGVAFIIIIAPLFYLIDLFFDSLIKLIQLIYLVIKEFFFKKERLLIFVYDNRLLTFKLSKKTKNRLIFVSAKEIDEELAKKLRQDFTQEQYEKITKILNDIK